MKMPAMERFLKNRFLFLAIIALAGLVAYCNTFDVPFQFDDDVNIVQNPFIKDLSNFTGPEGKTYYKTDVFLKSRFVGYLSFALNYRAHGLEVWGYHAVNLAIHISNALLLYWLVLLTFRTPAVAASPLSGSSRYVALFSALLFVSHPVQTQAVTYIVQRFASLAAFFCLLSTAAYAKARLSSKNAPRYAFYAISLLSAALAMRTKETAFTLPLAIALYDLVFLGGPARRRLLYLAPLALTMLLVPLAFLGAGGPDGGLAGGARLAAGMSRVDYLLTELRVVVTYLRLIFLPVAQNLDYDYPVYRSALAPQVLMSAAFLLSTALFGLYQLHRSRQGEPAKRLVAFGIFWFFLSLAVESSVIPIEDVIFEHRVYLPSAGAFVAVSAGGAVVLGRLGPGALRKALLAFIVMLPLVLSSASYARNSVWRSDLSLWEDVVGKAPNNARGHYNLGVAYESRGRADRAAAHYKTAIGIRPDYVEARNNLGVVYRSMGLVDKAIEQYLICIRLRPDYAKPHFNLANAYQGQGMLEEAAAHFKLAIKLKPDLDAAHVNLGLLYKQKGMLRKAVEHFERAIRIRPENAAAHMNLGNVYLSRGELAKAIAQYKVSVALRPDDPDAHYNLGVAYRKSGEAERAEEHLRISRELRAGGG